MATAVLSPCLNGELLPIVRHEVDVRPKRRRVKNVTWQTEDKLCQVRMFSSDDAPSISGFMIQDLLQAPITSSKQGKDLPPGFEGDMNKRFRLDAVSMKSMAVERPWHSPDKFLLDCAWLVVEGEDSTEIVSQQQREVRVLEAVYPRPSSIPLSPAEPLENWENIDDSVIPQIPSLPVEDQDEVFKEGSSLGFSMSVIGQYGATRPYSSGVEAEKTSFVHQQPDAKEFEESSLSVTKAETPQYGLVSANLSNIDCSITAAAAAAAHASMKSLKGSSLVDDELLFEIQRNPVLMKTLLSSSQTLSKSIEESLVNFSNRKLANDSGMSNEEHILESSCLPICLQPNIQGVSKVDVSFKGNGLRQGVETSEVHAQLAIGGVDSWNSFCSIIHSQDQSHMRTGSIGHANGAQGADLQVFEGSPRDFEMKLQAGAPSGILAGQPNCFGGLFRVPDSHNVQSMQGLKDTNSNLYGERQRMMRLGSQPEVPARGKGLPEPCIQNQKRGDVAVMSFPDARLRPRKPCLYFNTPKGCRNGANCCFLHELSIEN